jgi:hypothetical protein
VVIHPFEFMKNISPFTLWARLPAAWRFAVEGYFALRVFYFLWSALIFTVTPLAVREFNIFGSPILTVFDMRTSFRAAYEPIIDNHLLTFIAIRNVNGQIADLQTGSRWDILNGEAVSGEYAGRSLSRADYSVDKIFPYFGLNSFPNSWVSVWQRFDTNWYVSIAERGYGVIPDDIHFPPLYPLLVKLFARFFGDGFVAGMVVSGLATLMCLKMLYDLFQSWEGKSLQKSSASRGLVYFLIFPASFFLFGAYTEGLFIVTAILALQCMKKGQWLYSGIWISCATLIRLQGIALFLPLLYCMWNDRKILRRLSAFTGLCLASIGILVYVSLRAIIGSGGNVIPLAENNLYARMAFPWDNFIYAFRILTPGSMNYIDILNLVVSLLFLALIVLGWKYVPFEYNLYLIATYLVLTMRVVDTQPLNSMLRYVLTLFPSFYVLGIWGKHPLVHRLILYPSFILLLFLCAQFWMWGWVA